MTTSPRLPLVEVPEDPLTRDLFDRLAPGRGILNLHRMMAHAPQQMKASGELALALRRQTQLPRSLAEIVILRIAQLTACDYERAQHLPLAREAGVSEAQIAEVGGWRDSKAFTPEQRAALAFTETAARGLPADDADIAELRRYFSPREIVELTMLIGFYVSTAIFINSLAIPAEKI
jgi:4-carboxymuconolactone decarboxylase